MHRESYGGLVHVLWPWTRIKLLRGARFRLTRTDAALHSRARVLDFFNAFNSILCCLNSNIQMSWLVISNVAFVKIHVQRPCSVGLLLFVLTCAAPWVSSALTMLTAYTHMAIHSAVVASRQSVCQWASRLSVMKRSHERTAKQLTAEPIRSSDIAQTNCDRNDDDDDRCTAARTRT